MSTEGKSLELVLSSPSVAEFKARQNGTAQELFRVLFGSKTACARVFAQGQLRWAKTGERVAASSRITAGDRLVLELEPPEGDGHAKAEPAQVLWHDRFALVANKPCGVLVHGDGTGAPTLTDGVRASLACEARRKGWPYVPQAQAVNRLDVDTSGIVLYSLTKEFQARFDALVAGHTSQLRKRYVAVVRGSMPREPLTIDAPLARDRHDARRMRVGSTGKPAQTRVACVGQAQGLSLVACELLTGRRHQIRVHLAHLGHPILGDVLYGSPVPSARQDGLMLHALQIAFEHPVTNESLLLATEWPQRFARLPFNHEIDWSILD